MRVNLNESIYPFDVDQTLVSERRSSPQPGDIKIFNPYTREFVYVKPHAGHINLLKEMKGRGRFIRVHSAAGVRWAEAVVKALKIKKWVDDCETKPLGYIDDQPVSKWLRNRIYLTPQERS